MPSEVTFSPAFGEFTYAHLPERAHAVPIERALKDHLVGHIARDATAIEAREKPVKRDKPPAEARKRKRGRPRKGPSLRKLLKQQRVSAGTIRRRLLELQALGFSGRVPPNYWLNWRSHSMFWGATDKELRRFHKQNDSGKPVNDLTSCWRKRMKPALAATRKALNGIELASAMPTAGFAGTIAIVPVDKTAAHGEGQLRLVSSHRSWRMPTNLSIAEAGERGRMA